MEKRDTVQGLEGVEASAAHTKLCLLNVCSLLFVCKSRARGLAIRVDAAKVPADEVLRLRAMPLLVSLSPEAWERNRRDVLLATRGLTEERRGRVCGEMSSGMELGWHSSSLRPGDSEVRRVKFSAIKANLSTSMLHCARDICSRCKRREGCRESRRGVSDGGWSNRLLLSAPPGIDVGNGA